MGSKQRHRAGAYGTAVLAYLLTTVSPGAILAQGGALPTHPQLCGINRLLLLDLLTARRSPMEGVTG